MDSGEGEVRDKKDVGETYMSRKRENIGLTTGSGKERSAQSMSELLEKILDSRNMNEAYKKFVPIKEQAAWAACTVV